MAMKAHPAVIGAVGRYSEQLPALASDRNRVCCTTLRKEASVIELRQRSKNGCVVVESCEACGCE